MTPNERITIDVIEKYMYLFDGKRINFGNPSFAHPIFIAMLQAYQKDKGIKVIIGNSYIQKMLSNQYSKDKTYSPIENVVSRNGLEKISSHLTDIMLQHFMGLQEFDKKELRNYLQYLFLELMNNVSDHSESPVGGYVMAQYFSTKKKIQFVVADRGVGFLDNIQLKYADVTNELEAINKALKKGITSTKPKLYGHERNAGFGLYAMFEILRMTGGRFVIISNDTLLRFNDETFTSKKLATPWKGAVVAFEFDQSFITHDIDEFKRMYLWNEVLEEDEDFF